jgi:hypothetical protein
MLPFPSHDGVPGSRLASSSPCPQNADAVEYLGWVVRRRRLSSQTCLFAALYPKSDRWLCEAKANLGYGFVG